MKESKFIELLNLYVDQQIEPAEARQLEEEILRNPERRRLYQQYCKMQRACTLLVEQARPDVEVGEKFASTVAVAHERVMEFPVPARRLGKFVVLGGLAAACFALAFVSGRFLRQSPAPHDGGSADQIVQIAPAAAQRPTPGAGAVNYQPVLLTHALRMSSGSPSPVSSSLTNDRLSLDWMSQVKFTPLTSSSEELALGAPARSLQGRADATAVSFELQQPRPALEGEEETIAIRFKR